MKENLIRILSRTGELTESVCTYHRRGLLCFWLPGDCPPGEAGKWDNRTDIYRIGTLLFREVVLCADGRPMPFHRARYGQIRQLLADSCIWQDFPKSERPQAERLLCDLLQRCLSPRPPGRYRCCEELLCALEQLIRLLTGTQVPPP